MLKTISRPFKAYTPKTPNLYTLYRSLFETFNEAYKPLDPKLTHGQATVLWAGSSGCSDAAASSFRYRRACEARPAQMKGSSLGLYLQSHWGSGLGGLKDVFARLMDLKDWGSGFRVFRGLNCRH